MNNKVYYPLKDYKDYFISIDGEVINKNKDVIKPTKENKIRINGKYKSLKVLYRNTFETEYCKDNIEDLQDEVWKEIEGTKGKYYISTAGRVKSYCHYTAKILKPYNNGKNYYRVSIDSKDYLIHRLAASAFLDDKGTTETVHHINADTRDNSITNLAYMTRADNAREAYNRTAKVSWTIKTLTL